MGYDFTKETAERIVRAVREVEARPPNLIGVDPAGAFGEPVPVWVRNEGPTTDDDIPAYGVAAVVGTTVFQGLPLVLVEKPSTTFRKTYVACGEAGITKDDHGLAYFGTATVIYSTPPTTALQGYGPKPGSYALDTFYPQTCESLGIVNSSTVAGSSATPTMLATMHSIESLLVKATTPIAGSSEGAAEILFGVAPSETTSGWRVTVKTLSNQSFTSGDEFFVKDIDGQWYPLGSGADVKLAVDTSNVGMYASTLLAPWNETTQYVANKDLEIEFEAQGTTPNQSVRAFVDADAYPGFQTGVQQLLGKDSTDNIQWTTLSAAANDEKLAATSENTGVYWNQLHDSTDVNLTTAYNSTQDFRVETEVFGTTPNQTIKLFVDVSDLPNWTGSGHQFFMTGSSAALVMRNANSINVTTVYNSSQDLLAEPELDGSNIFWHVDVSGIPSYSTASEQYLTNSSGQTKWTTGTGGTDELVAVTSNDTPNYLGTLLTGFSTVSSFELNNDLFVDHEYNAGEILSFVDASGIANYSATVRQYLSHSTAAEIQWTTGIGGGTDELLAATSENNGKFWSALHAEFNATTQLSTSFDFIIESEVAGTTPDQTIRQYIDASDITNYDNAYDQLLMHKTSGGPVWRRLIDQQYSTNYNSTQDMVVKFEWTAGVNSDVKAYVDASAISAYSTASEQVLTNSSGFTYWAAGRDEKVAISSGHTPNYLGTLHTGYSTAATFEIANDFTVDHEENGSEILSFIDVSDIPGYAPTTPQLLGHADDATLEWTTPSASGTDEKLAATSENNGLYWNVLHTDFNATTFFNTAQDLLVESEVTGTTPSQTIKQYVDMSQISGWSLNALQFLGKTTGGTLEWFNATTCT
jgi:hypothetical protein